jgi:hypothetical protein
VTVSVPPPSPTAMSAGYISSVLGKRSSGGGTALGAATAAEALLVQLPSPASVNPNEKLDSDIRLKQKKKKNSG